MNHPKTGDEELELLVKAERAYANRTEEFCNDYKSWMAGARSVVCAHQSETDGGLSEADKVVMAALKQSDKFHEMELNKYREVIDTMIQVHQSQLKEAEEKLKIAKEALTLIEYVDNHGGVNQYRSCAEIAKEALGKIE
jgi:tellurite resistance protein